MLRLRATADGGNAACRLLLDWLQNRNRDLAPFGNKHLSLTLATGSASVFPPSGSPPPRRRRASVCWRGSRNPVPLTGGGVVERVGAIRCRTRARHLLPRRWESAQMDKLARLLVRRLRHLARREARRIALRNGLLESKIVDVDGHLTCRYSPAFDTTRLTAIRSVTMSGSGGILPTGLSPRRRPAIRCRFWWRWCRDRRAHSSAVCRATRGPAAGASRCNRESRSAG